MTGWVKVHRVVWDHPLFARQEMSEREAWLWLVSHAAHSPTRHRVKTGLVDVQRGSLFVTLRSLAAEWRWKSVKRVRTFLARLESETMIRTETGTGKTQITICNYEKFQASGHTEETQKAQDGHKTGTLNKNGKNYKKSSKEDGEAPSLRKQIFDRGKAMLGTSSGGLLNRWLGEHSEEVVFGAIVAAEGKGDPKAFIVGVLRNRAKSNPDAWLQAHGIPDLDGGDDDTRGNFSVDRAPPAHGGDDTLDVSDLLAYPAQKAGPLHVREYVQ